MRIYRRARDSASFSDGAKEVRRQEGTERVRARERERLSRYEGGEWLRFSREFLSLVRASRHRRLSSARSTSRQGLEPILVRTRPLPSGATFVETPRMTT